jgi:hypothetical protein
MLLTIPDAVATTLHVLPDPIDHRHSTLLSDCHRLASAPDPPTPTRPLISWAPYPLTDTPTHAVSSTVISALPAAATFMLLVGCPDTLAKSYDHPMLKLPSLPPPTPLVTTTLPDPPIPTAT